MKIVPNFGSCAFIVPDTVRNHIKKADKTALACLLYIMAEHDFNIKAASDELGVDEDDFASAVRFWEEAGVLSVPDTEKKSTKSGSKNVKLTKESRIQKGRISSSLPAYTTEETARFLESNAATAEIIDSCENIIGKIFTTAETNIIIGMLDHLSLSGDYILLLFAHAAKIDKKSVRYIEKLALSFVDRDITKYSELEEELAKIDKTEDGIQRIRTLFGLGSRTLTAKEKKMISDWYVTWGMTHEMVEKAYEVTVNATGEASLNYANSVLKNWFSSSIKTPEDVERNSAEFEKNKKSGGKGYQKNTNNAPLSNSSFDTDDFFEAALKRSFDDDI